MPTRSAKVTVETTTEHLRVLGADKDHPTAIVDVYAPVSGVITDQAGHHRAAWTHTGSGVAQSVHDFRHVARLGGVRRLRERSEERASWGICRDVRLERRIRTALSARGIDNIGPILDPNIRTAKVRLEVENDGLMRFGMFATANPSTGWRRKIVRPCAC